MLSDQLEPFQPQPVGDKISEKALIRIALVSISIYLILYGVVYTVTFLQSLDLILSSQFGFFSSLLSASIILQVLVGIVSLVFGIAFLYVGTRRTSKSSSELLRTSLLLVGPLFIFHGLVVLASYLILTSQYSFIFNSGTLEIIGLALAYFIPGTIIILVCLGVVKIKILDR